MRRTADSWFILELADDNFRAYRIIDKVERRGDELVIPTVIITELHRVFSRQGDLRTMKQIFNKLDTLPNVEIVPCDREIAYKAGSLSSTYGLPSIDAIVAATAILTKSHALLSGDGHFKPLRKQKLLKIESW